MKTDYKKQEKKMEKDNLLKDGYYLTVYSAVSDIGHVYSFQIRHNHSIALWLKNNNIIELVHYWELERMTASKEHHVPFFNKEHFYEFIKPLLMQYSLTLEDIQAIWGTPILDSDDAYQAINEHPQFAYHSICHLYSSLFMDTDLLKSSDSILSMAMDGEPDNLIDKNVKDKYHFVGAFKRNSDIALFPIASPGPIWYWARCAFGLKEGTLMALANIGTKNICKISENKYRNIILDYCKMMEAGVYETPVFMKTLVYDAEKLIDAEAYESSTFNKHEKKISLVMDMVQKMSKWIMDYNLEIALNKFDIDFKNTILSLSGGFALNCPTNTYLMKKYNFKGFIAPPCINDSGQAMGIGLYSFNKLMGDFSFRLKNAYYGDSDDISEETIKIQYKGSIKSVSSFDAIKAVQDLISGPIVWFEGRSEMGPRALGGRSILADPRTTRTKDLLNKIKQREWWRPVAPIVLEECIDEYFLNAFPSPYMLHTFDINPQKIDLIPAVAHLDGSARIQSISQNSEKKYLIKLMNEFYRQTACAVICNTSLNDKGEPIINKFNEAINFAIRKDIKIIYINGMRVELIDSIINKPTSPDERKPFKYISEKEALDIKKAFNLYSVSEEVVHHYIRFNYYGHSLNLTNEKDIKMIKKLSTMQKKYDSIY
jgi:predicted NodU family carbamoyl transferase